MLTNIFNITKRTSSIKLISYCPFTNQQISNVLDKCQNLDLLETVFVNLLICGLFQFLDGVVQTGKLLKQDVRNECETAKD